MIYRLKSISDTGTIFLIGCGGTGGFVAEGLCRLLSGSKHQLFLLDHDRVEESNIGRQNFFKSDIGKFKARVLAERLAVSYNMPIGYQVKPIEQLWIGDRGELTIGCVDNSSARERLQYAGQRQMGPKHSYCKRYEQSWYIDAGNGEYSGQVLIGNALLRESQKGFYPNEGLCRTLPLPQVQQPALLAPQATPRRDCAQAVQAQEQSPVINRIMADLVVTFVHKLLTNTLSWMGAYVDLEAGSMTTAQADPATVARITGLTVRQLEYRPRAEKVMVRA